MFILSKTSIRSNFTLFWKCDNIHIVWRIFSALSVLARYIFSHSICVCAPPFSIPPFPCKLKAAGNNWVIFIPSEQHFGISISVVLPEIRGTHYMPPHTPYKRWHVTKLTTNIERWLNPCTMSLSLSIKHISFKTKPLLSNSSVYMMAFWYHDRNDSTLLINYYLLLV